MAISLSGRLVRGGAAVRFRLGLTCCPSDAARPAPSSCSRTARGRIDTSHRQRDQPVQQELRPVGQAVTGGGYAGDGIALGVEGCMPVTDDVRCARRHMTLVGGVEDGAPAYKPGVGTCRGGAVSTDLSEGQTFGAYHIVGIAGSGGMGVVYRAEQRSLGRTVALKVIRPETAESGDYRSR